MSVNSSSSSDFFVFLFFECLVSEPYSIIFNTFNIATILLLLPLCVFILHHGLQQWRQKKSSASSAVAVSHSDCFAYHAVAMELIRVSGCFLCCCGVYTEDLMMMLVGGLFLNFTWYGETFFHVLTCVERYLAVVHPITYLSLRNQRGIRIRNISIAGAWLLSLGAMCLIMIEYLLFVDFSIFLLCLTAISFCSLSVLRVLIRPGPGEQGGRRARVDQSKLRAFYTILSILGVLALRFAASISWSVVYAYEQSTDCMTMTVQFWFNLPCSLVLPLLFLHRAGKFAFCKKSVR